MQKYKVGPVLFLVELFYFNISIIKGVSRIILLVFLNLDSFYTPAKCAFPDGKESWDGGHLTFVCYAMARVEADKQLQAQPRPSRQARPLPRDRCPTQPPCVRPPISSSWGRPPAWHII